MNSTQKIKPKIAIFDLTGCQGCEFHLLGLNEHLLEFFQDFEITNWRLLGEQDKKDFDIAFIEGAATTQKHIKLLKEIRSTSKIVIAIGSCAISGNFFSQLSEKQREKLAKKIYNKDYIHKAKFLAPVEKFMKVDEKIPGCPPKLEGVKKILKKLKQTKITSKIKKVAPPDFTAKIEGHGVLNINFKQKQAEFKVEESERFVEGLLLDKNPSQAPFIVSRICGICPIAHNLCSIGALEAALRITPSKTTITLRKILLSAQMIKSHLLHLFFLVLPDYAGIKDSIELSQTYPAEFHLMLNIKRVTDKILEKIALSPTFPTNTQIGGFRQAPKMEDLHEIKNSIYDVIDESQDLIKLFYNLKTPNLKVKTTTTTINPPQNSYPYYMGNTDNNFKEIVKNDSTAKLAFLKENQPIKVGALSRIRKFSFRLHPKAQKALSQFPISPENPFHNNLAQSIEILHFLEEVENLISQINEKDLSKITPNKKIASSSNQAEGKFFLEAPRGILFHHVKINPKGKISDYNIIPPTQINLASLERETQQLIEKESSLSQAITKKHIQQLIRAFDPCITCAVH